MGVRRIVALRGDPPKGEDRFVPHPDGFKSAAELVGIRGIADRGIEIDDRVERARRADPVVQLLAVRSLSASGL